MDEFIESIIKFILENWEDLPTQRKEQIREKIINTVISFVGEGKQHDKELISIHLN